MYEQEVAGSLETLIRIEGKKLSAQILSFKAFSICSGEVFSSHLTQKKTVSLTKIICIHHKSYFLTIFTAENSTRED